jgi:hypothetical protein
MLQQRQLQTPHSPMWVMTWIVPYRLGQQSITLNGWHGVMFPAKVGRVDPTKSSKVGAVLGSKFDALYGF